MSWICGIGRPRYLSGRPGRLENNILAIPGRLENNKKNRKSLKRSFFAKKLLRGFAKPEPFLRAPRAVSNIHNNLVTQRIPGAEFDEVMYADDTILISENTKTMNQYIKQIEIIGKQYGLNLNKKKCELLTTEQDPDIHFQNKEK